MKEVLVDAKIFKEEVGVRRLQAILATTIANSIKDRISKEMTRCIKNKDDSHWMQRVLPSRIMMLLCRSFDDKLLQGSEENKLDKRINTALFSKKNKNSKTPLVLYFQILERYFLFKRLRDAGPEHNEDYIMMVFYESVPEHPDLRLQEILSDVFKGAGISVVVK